MSITRMRRRFSVTLKKVLWLIIVAFVITIPATFGGLTGKFGGGCAKPEGDPHQVIAVVNREKMTRAVLDEAFVSQWQLLTYGRTPPHLPLQQISDVRLQGFDKALDRMLQMQEARRRKIRASDREIAAKIDEQVDQQMENIESQAQQTGKSVAEIMRSTMAAYGEKADKVTEAEFKQWLKQWWRKEDRLRGLEEEIVLKELQDRVGAEINPTWADVLRFYDKMNVQEIQFRIKAEVEDPELRTYPKEEVLEVAKKAAERARKGEDFTKLVMEYSSDPLATKGPGGDETQATKGITGFLNIDERFKLRYSSAVAKEMHDYKDGQIVGPVFSKVLRAYFVFKVLGKRNDQPEGLNDPDKREEYLRNFRDRRRRDAFKEFKEELREKATIDIKDPEIKAAQAKREREFTQATKLYEQALQYLTPWYDTLPRGATLAPTALAPGAVYCSLGEMAALRRNWKKASEYYEAGLGFLSHDPLSLADMYFVLAHNEWQWMTALSPDDAAERENRKQKTVQWLESMLAVAPDNATVRENAIWLYEPMGMRDLVAEQRVWLADYYEQEGPNQNKSRALEHRRGLLKYYQGQGDQEKAAEQKQNIERLEKELAEQPPSGPPGGISLSPAP